jgi:hypothetical protein
MPLVRGKDVALNPVDVSLFVSDAVMVHPNHFADLIKQFGHARDFCHQIWSYLALLRMNSCWMASVIYEPSRLGRVKPDMRAAGDAWP